MNLLAGITTLLVACVASTSLVMGKSLDRRKDQRSGGAKRRAVGNKRVALETTWYRGGDILLTDRQKNGRRLSQRSKSRYRAQSLHHSTITPWKHQTVYYDFRSFPGTKQDRGIIRKAMSYISEFTCLKFKRRTKRTSCRDYITFTDTPGKGCESYVGMTGGRQELNLELSIGCVDETVVIHELLHALGFEHTHQRPDRNKYVTIKLHNAEKVSHYAFEKYSPYALDTMGLPYDYHSIMHYGDRAFSSNGRRTILTRNRRMQHIIGTTTIMSTLDIKAVNKFYKCKQNTYTDLQGSGGSGMSIEYVYDNSW